MKTETLGVYQLKRLLGRGGMGSVYVAHDPRLARDVALKVLSPDLAQKPEHRERFVAEARSCSALNHPNITTIHEIGEADGVHFIAFELVEGETLESILDRDVRLAPERVVDIALALSGALAYAHDRGIVHRDLKPANVVLSELGVPKILDFGLAKTMPGALGAVGPESETMVRLTQAGMVVGTIAYMAPEQALGQTVDARSDVFAFGCLLYEMLVGERPFAGATATQLLDHLLHEEPARVDAQRPDVSPRLADVVDKALRKPMGERYQSMHALRGDLERLEQSTELEKTRKDTARPESATHRMRTKRARRGVMATAGLALVAALALFLVNPRDTPGLDDDAVAVMYFENLSDPTDEGQTARMLTQLLTSELSSLGEVDVMSHQRLHDIARGLGLENAEVDRSIATAVAEAAGVRTMIVGRVAEAGGRLMATTELVDVVTGRSMSSQQASGLSADDIFVLADSLGEQLRVQLTSTPVTDWASTPATFSVDAYRHYVEGEMFLHASELDSAVEEFTEAVRLDPEFSLAHHRLSVAARWLSDGALAHQAARRAAASLDRAPSHLRDVIEANALYQDGAFSRAIPLLERTLERDPDQKEVLYILGQIYVHSLRDGDTALAIERMEHLLSLDPSFHQIYDRLALSYAFSGDADAARARMAEWDVVHPAKVEGLRSILATLEGQPEEALGFGQAFSWIEGPLFQAAAAMMASRWDVARRFTEQDPDEWRSDHLRAWALRNRAVFHTYVGEFDQALDFYRQAGMASGFRTHEGGSGGVPASALHAAAELLYLDGEIGAARTEIEKALSIQPDSWRGLYFAGRMALFDDDTEAAERYLSTIEDLPAAATSASAQMYLDALTGELALYRGRDRVARDIFEALVSRPLMLDWSSTCSSAGAAIRDGLVRSYVALGDDERASQAMEDLLASGAERLDHPVIYARTLYQLGVHELESGSRVQGRRLLERFLGMWSDADWEEEMVDDARSRLES